MIKKNRYVAFILPFRIGIFDLKKEKPIIESQIQPTKDIEKILSVFVLFLNKQDKKKR